jgi:hypothetical protein
MERREHCKRFDAPRHGERPVIEWKSPEILVFEASIGAGPRE